MRTFKAGIFCLMLSWFSFASHADDLVTFNIQKSGVYQVTHQQLVDAGLDLTGEPLSNIALVNRGSPVYIELGGSNVDASKFGAGAYIRFIGDELDTLYTGENVYVLQLNASNQQLITRESPSIPGGVPYATSYLEKAAFEPQNSYTFASPDPDDPWYAKRVLALKKPASETVSLELNDYVPGGNFGSTQAKLSISVWGASNLTGLNDDHHLQVSVNGTQVLDESFDGFSKHTSKVNLYELVEGTNSVRFSLPLDVGYDYEAVNIDSVEVAYPRAFVAKSNQLNFTSTFQKFRVQGFNQGDVHAYRRSAQGAITEIANIRNLGACDGSAPTCRVIFGSAVGTSEYFLASKTAFNEAEIDYLPIPKNIKQGQAEYLIITHPDFIADGSNGLLTQFRDSLVADGYASSADIVDVEQVYAQFGYSIFDPQAIRDYIEFAKNNRGTKTVLLVGGDIYDYRGFENQLARSFIPSIYAPISEMVNFSPVDAKYVDINDDNAPDLAIGRLPVRSLTELASLLSKRSDYLARGYTANMLFSADEFDTLKQYSFMLDAQSIANEHFSDSTVTTAYVDELGIGPARQRIINSINAGTSLTAFFGHSSTNQWTFQGLFNGFDAAALSNVGKPTIVTQWGCWNTYHVSPNEDSMGHRFMMEGEQGAVAVLGATSLTKASHEKLLAQKVFAQLASGKSLGESVRIAKQDLAAEKPEALDVILGWSLLGFPELSL